MGNLISSLSNLRTIAGISGKNGDDGHSGGAGGGVARSGTDVGVSLPSCCRVPVVPTCACPLPASIDWPPSGSFFPPR